MNTYTDIRNVAVNVIDQVAVLHFYNELLGFDDPDKNRFYVIEDQQ